MTLLGEDLIIPLNRPEYVSIPEGFLSSLAWSAYQVSNSLIALDSSGKKVGLVFHQEQQSTQNNNFVIRVTEPSGEKLKEFDKALEENGLISLDPASSLGEAILTSIRGVKAAKSSQIPASPLSPSLAMLQNSVGLQGKENPPDVAEILETMLDLGSPSQATPSLSLSLSSAYETRLGIDPLLKAIDSSVNQVVWGGTLTPRTDKKQRERKGANLAPYLSETPFAWFALTWSKLMSEEWIQALPARVWVDWVTTSLRSIYALGFLWETTWYEALAREILNSEVLDADLTVSRILASQEKPINWRSNSSSAEIRNLSSKLKWRCYRSVEIRRTLNTWLQENSSEKKELGKVIGEMKKDGNLCAELASLLNMDKNQNNGPGSNLWEAIRYTLSPRESGDFYGLFKSNGPRYLFADPGSEWIAVMASVASSHPGFPTDLGSVSKLLTKLGANPHPTDLLQYLESAGLARGSADADLGVIVETAFGSRSNVE